MDAVKQQLFQLDEELVDCMRLRSDLVGSDPAVVARLTEENVSDMLACMWQYFLSLKTARKTPTGVLVLLPRRMGDVGDTFWTKACEPARLDGVILEDAPGQAADTYKQQYKEEHTIDANAGPPGIFASQECDQRTQLQWSTGGGRTAVSDEMPFEDWRSSAIFHYMSVATAPATRATKCALFIASRDMTHCIVSRSMLGVLCVKQAPIYRAIYTTDLAKGDEKASIAMKIATYDRIGSASEYIAALRFRVMYTSPPETTQVQRFAAEYLDVRADEMVDRRRRAAASAAAGVARTTAMQGGYGRAVAADVAVAAANAFKTGDGTVDFEDGRVTVRETVLCVFEVDNTAVRLLKEGVFSAICAVERQCTFTLTQVVDTMNGKPEKDPCFAAFVQAANAHVVVAGTTQHATAYRSPDVLRIQDETFMGNCAVIKAYMFKYIPPPVKRENSGVLKLNHNRPSRIPFY